MFGASTQTAVIRNFQRVERSAVTGVARCRHDGEADGGSGGRPRRSGQPPAPPRTPRSGCSMGAQGSARQVAAAGADQQPGSRILGGADGSFGAATKAALIAYQNANGLSRLGHRRRGDRGETRPRCRRRGAGRTRGIGQSVRRAEGWARRATRVKHLQRALIQTGLALRGGADGSFGAATQTVLTTFQKTNGTPQTGVVGEQDAVDARPHRIGPDRAARRSSSGSGYPVFGEHGDRVKAMQKSLLDTGIKVPGGADGVFGSSTAGAIMEFQRREGIPVTGKMDDQTAGRLGQAAAPAPVPPSASGIALPSVPGPGPVLVR